MLAKNREDQRRGSKESIINDDLIKNPKMFRSISWPIQINIEKNLTSLDKNDNLKSKVAPKPNYFTKMKLLHKLKAIDNSSSKYK